jgi:mono/diheme cytochrome c family protein
MIMGLLTRYRTVAFPLFVASAILAVCHAADANDVDKAAVQRGAYVATASDCAACHTAPGGLAFAGGLSISSPVGNIYSSNITPSASAGIGDYTEVDFARAVREGIRKDGANLYPAMPYTSYRLLTDADVSDLYVYFMHGVTPVDLKPPQTSLAFPMNIRMSMKIWNLLFLHGGAFAADQSHTADWNRGEYLVAGAAHCSTCHTPRGFLMQELAGENLTGAQVGTWYAPNITSDPVSGIGSWSQPDLVGYLHSGVLGGNAQAAGSMGEAVQHSFQYLSTADIDAIATYIRTIPPAHDPADVASRFSYGQASPIVATLRGRNGVRSDDHDSPSGAELFQSNCASCHGAFGQGTEDGYYPRLFHNSATGGSSPVNLIAAILYGVNRDSANGPAYMPGFGGLRSDSNQLSDIQIAALSNYVLSQFGRAGKVVSPGDVAQERLGGPSSSLILLARIGIAVAAFAFLAIIVLLFFRFRYKPRVARFESS